mmetsp:Transcript_7321/g.14792  ORF Transcript_7321/g.14792 Transcript_7321/m.14792 type:complete len:122 (-) Transcript_7321:570-935(-)
MDVAMARHMFDTTTKHLSGLPCCKSRKLKLPKSSMHKALDATAGLQIGLSSIKVATVEALTAQAMNNVTLGSQTPLAAMGIATHMLAATMSKSNGTQSTATEASMAPPTKLTANVCRASTA